jgi:hypothetical protein
MIFPILPLLLCIGGAFISVVRESGVGLVLSAIGIIAVVIADAYLLGQRAKRPDFNSWDEI